VRQRDILQHVVRFNKKSSFGANQNQMSSHPTVWPRGLSFK